MARRTLALVLGAIATGGASGDIPSFHRPWIPDLDQLRATGGGFFGLPGTGDGYSAPAAAANLMVYIDRHGYTNMVPALTSGESLYADHAYREATTLLFNLGTSMSTGAVANGTLPFYVARGLRNRIEDQYPQGKFIVVHKDSTNADPVGPDDFAQVHSLGGMSIMYFRVHAQHISGTWLPVGGGFRTVTSVVGGEIDESKVRFRSARNPTSGDTLISQGAFRYHESGLNLGVYPIGASGLPLGDRQRWALTDLGEPDELSTIEGLVAVVPLFGMTLTPDLTQIQYAYPAGVLGDLVPQKRTITIPPGFTVSRMATNATSPGATILRPTVGASSLYIVHPVTGAFTFVEGVIGPGPMDFCRHNCLWYTEQLTLKKATIQDDGTVVIGPTLNLGSIPNALATMDELDQTAVLVSGQIRLYNGDLVLQDTDPVPDAAVMSGVPCFAPDPANPMDLLIASPGITRVHRIRRTASGWGYIEGIDLPTGTQVTSLEVGGDGDIFYVSGGRIRQLEKNLQGAWAPAPSPLFDPNTPVGPAFELPYSRSNGVANPDVDALPELLIDPPGDGIVGCDPDLTTSSDPNEATYGIPDGVLDASDFFFFLDRFVAEDRIVCDLTTTSDPNSDDYGAADGILDASDFFFYLDLFAAGCP
jgi:hypothetical protein